MGLIRFFAALALIVAPHEARAYECTPVPDAMVPLSQAWVSRCIPYVIGRQGALLGGEERRQLIAQSFQVWSSNPCTDIKFVDSGYTNDTAGFDSRKPSAQTNVIASVETSADLALFPDPQLLAITLTSFSVETGEIFDADILINGVQFTFQDVRDPVACEAARPYDLRNTLVHEMGHFIGFDHQANPESTMFASAPACETKKRDLEPDDRQGLCTVYPAAQPSLTCAPPRDGYDATEADPTQFRYEFDEATIGRCKRVSDGGSCSCTSARQEPQSLVLMLGLVGLLARRSRKRNAQRREGSAIIEK